MRILFVTPFYYPELKFGGPPLRIHSLAKALLALGHDVAVVTYHSEYRRGMEAVECDGVRVHYISWVGTPRRQIPTQYRPIDSAIHMTDVVHCYGLYNLLCPLAALVCSLHSKPYLLEPMGMFVPRGQSFSAKRLYNATITLPMARGAAAIVATSVIERDELMPLTAKNRLVIRRNGVDAEQYRELPSRATMRQRWQISPETRLVLYLGRIDRKKNLEQLILAFERTKVPLARLVLAGPVSDERYNVALREMIVARNLEGSVLLEGPLYREDQRAAFAAADLFVLPSLNENFGNAAAEAVAAGVPVLITNTCGIAPLIHGRAGLAVPLGVENLAQGLKIMLEDEAQRKKLTAKRQEVIRELSWDEPIQQTEQLYARILAGTPF